MVIGILWQIWGKNLAEERSIKVSLVYCSKDVHDIFVLESPSNEYGLVGNSAEAAKFCCLLRLQRIYDMVCTKRWKT